MALHGRRGHLGQLRSGGSEKRPLYRRPTAVERLKIWRLAAGGSSARAIGRAIGRDHHTVLRALQPDAGEDLAFSLAVLGEGRSAREVVACLNAPDDLSEEVEDTIVDYWIRFARELRRLERILVEA